MSLAPRDADDPFCTCPDCGLLGTHGREVRMLLPRSVGPVRPGSLMFGDGPDGDVFVVTWDDEPNPPAVIRAIRRVCVFCGHCWHTHPRRARAAELDVVV